MARSVTLQSIADRARFFSDQRYSSFTSPEDMLLLINDRFSELYDLLVDSFENYYSSTADLTIAPGTSEYDLPADFYKLLGVDFAVGNGAYITLKPFEEQERNLNVTTAVSLPSGTVRINYIPAPTVYTALTDTFDGVAGWDRLIALGVAIDMLDAEESDSAALTRKYNQTYDRVVTMAQTRDTSSPSRISDVYQTNFYAIYGALRYRLYGDQITLHNSEWIGGPVF